MNYIGTGCYGLYCEHFNDVQTFKLLTTFWKISVNASILSDSGGTCVCTTNDLCVSDQTYLLCLNEVQQDLITSTAAISALSTFLMGLLANLPVGLAPGLGLNAYVSAICACGVRRVFPLTLLLVRVLCRWFPWKWENHLSRSPGGRVPGGVSAGPCLHVTNLTYRPFISSVKGGFSSSCPFLAFGNGSCALCPIHWSWPSALA